MGWVSRVSGFDPFRDSGPGLSPRQFCSIPGQESRLVVAGLLLDDLQDVRRRFFWLVELEFCVLYIGLRQFRDRSSGMYGQ